MRQVLIFIQVIVSILLIGLILMQARGTGFGRATGFISSSSFSRRGLEKLVFRMTFIVGLIFILVSIVSLLA